jgi:hypothetical protein
LLFYFTPYIHVFIFIRYRLFSPFTFYFYLIAPCYELHYLHFRTPHLKAIIFWVRGNKCSSFVPVTWQPNSKPGRITVETSLTHTITHTYEHPVAPLWTSDQPLAQAATYTTHDHPSSQCDSITGSLQASGLRPTP